MHHNVRECTGSGNVDGHGGDTVGHGLLGRARVDGLARGDSGGFRRRTAHAVTFGSESWQVPRGMDRIDDAHP